MQRFAMEKLKTWKDTPHRKPLVIMGARQVGKTWLMKEFGRLYYKKVAYISFYNNAAMNHVFEQDYDINRIISAINIEVGFTVSAADTLIIFDEIQNSPKAFESLKYFCEDAPEYHIMVAGSLLGVALHEGISYPVGKITTLNLYPMNFREFLHATGDTGLADALTTKDYKTSIRSQSLKAFHDKFHPELSIRLSLLNYKEQDWMVNLPLYAVCNM